MLILWEKNEKIKSTVSWVKKFIKISNPRSEYDIPYKLGCGDGNKSQTNKDGSKNYLYQEWCGNSWNGHSHP